MSTPTYNASVQKDVQKTVRKNAMLRYKNRHKRSPPSVTMLQHDALVNYLGSRGELFKKDVLEKVTSDPLEDITLGMGISQDTGLEVVPHRLMPLLSRKPYRRPAMSFRVVCCSKYPLP